MAAGVRSIAIRFLGDTKDLDKAGAQGEKSLSKWKGAFRKLDKVATGVLVGLGGAIAGAVVSMAAAGDEIAKSANKAGVGAEQYQELRFAFDHAGISAGTFDTALQKFNKRLGEAVEGSGPAADQFDALGISLETASGKTRDSGAVLDESLEVLAGIENDAERAAAAGDLFGQRAGPELASALGSGIEGIDKARERAQELGIVMDSEALKASEDFSDAMTDLKLVGAALVRDFAGPFLEVFVNDIVPVLNEQVLPAVRAFGDFLSEHSGLVLIIAGALAGLAATIKVVSVVIKIVTAVQWLWNTAMSANPIGLIILAIAALIAIIILIIANWDTVKRVFFQVWDAIFEFFRGFISWIAETFWENGLKKYFELWGAIIGWVRDRFVAGINRIIEFGGNVLDWFRNLPGKIRDFMSGLADKIPGPFKTGFNAIANAWNNTVGSLSWTVPGWVPIIGGNTISAPTLPTFHRGGTVPGMPGEEVLAVLEAGEQVTPADEARDSRDGGDTHVHVQAWSDRFSWAQVQDELAMHGVT